MRHLRLFNDIMEIYNKHYVSYGDYSVTRLIDTPMRVQLSKRYGDIAIPNPRYQVGSFIGTAVHELVEKYLRMKYAGDEKVELEKTVAHPFMIPSHIRTPDYGDTFSNPNFKEQDDRIRMVAGKFDILYDKVDLIDNKAVNVWALIFDRNMVKWHEQQNLYAYLLHLRGTDIKTLTIAAWFKDWKEGDAIRDKTYPQDQYQEYKLELWPWDVTERLLESKLYDHVCCENFKDNDLPECSSEDRWERFPKGEVHQYAVMKNKFAKRAARVFKTMSEAREYVRGPWKGQTTDSFVEVRHAQRKRCEKYCSVCDYCNHYIEYCKKKKTDTLNDIIPISEI